MAEVSKINMGGIDYDIRDKVIEEVVQHLNEGGLLIKDEIIERDVNNWLNEHPEATTTVQEASLTEKMFTEDLKKATLNNYVTPQMYGAIGDGLADDTAAFEAMQQSGKNIYVPYGKYVLNNFTFSASVEWRFQPSNGGQWFADGCAEVHTNTGLVIENSPKIHNLKVVYNGVESDIAKRPIGIKMSSFWAEIHGLHISHFNIGMAFGAEAGRSSAYTRIYDANIWYCYFAGVSLNSVDEAQANFISFYDCNIGSSGVDVHNKEAEPNISRGYGFHIASCNGVVINNCDVSSNETCGFFIDSSSTEKRVRGLFVPVFYAENNKFCAIYFKNSRSSSATRTGDIDFATAYVAHNGDNFFKSIVYAEDVYFPPCVKFLNFKGTQYAEGKSQMLEYINNVWDVFCENGSRIDNFSFYGKASSTYRVNLRLRGLSTGTITFQNVINAATFNKSEIHYNNDMRIEAQKAFNISIEEGEVKEITFDVTMPTSEHKLCFYRTLSYGASAEVIDGKVELVNSQDL